uniref:Uncharacterized protein n=1 Tax=Setaria viridis TaxID=4556 RepID=A0A4V6DBD3_SETVI|nr:hypothetical protein SEVIR_2G187350v2 [Setaria viridis]
MLLHGVSMCLGVVVLVLQAGPCSCSKREACKQWKAMSLPLCLHCLQG